MRKEDLMIGDWVNIQTEKDDEPMYSQVEQLWECEIDADFQTGYENVYPIELTEEILRNNGFIKVDFLRYDEPRIGISLLYKERSDGEQGYRVLIENRKSGTETRTTIKPVRYVHEIQHTIKDLEIDREIIL